VVVVVVEMGNRFGPVDEDEEVVVVVVVVVVVGDGEQRSITIGCDRVGVLRRRLLLLLLLVLLVVVVDALDEGDRGERSTGQNCGGVRRIVVLFGS
jgi:hypothetical protein